MTAQKSDRPFPDDYYHADTGIYIPRIHNKPWYEWYTVYGCKTPAEIDAKAAELAEAEQWDEARMDRIGQNGNVGYTEEEICLSYDTTTETKDDEKEGSKE